MIGGLNNRFTSIGKPQQLYSDEERSMRFAKVSRLFRESEIKSVQITTDAQTGERFIITFKDNLYRVQHSIREDEIKWVAHTYKVFNKHIIQLSIARFKSSLMKQEEIKSPLQANLSEIV